MLLAQLHLPGEPVPVAPQVGSTSGPFLDYFEQHSAVVYPALTVVVLALLVLGIVQAWRAPTLDGRSKARYKEEVLAQLRNQGIGSSAEELSRLVGLEPLKLGFLLEEMQREGTVSSHTSTDRRTFWQIKGLSFTRRR